MLSRRAMTWAERALCDAATTGAELDVRPQDRGGPAGLSERDRVISADLVHDLLVGGDDIHSKGIRILGATIVGILDFEFATVRAPLILEGCHLVPDGADALNLQRSLASWVSLRHCVVDGNVVCDQLRATHSVDLRHAEITGIVAFDGSHVDGSIRMDSATVGPVSLAGAHVEGSLRMQGTTVHGPVTMPGAKIGGSVLLVASEVGGSVSMDDAQVGSNLDLRSARVTDVRPDVVTLCAERVEVGGAVVLDGLRVCRTPVGEPIPEGRLDLVTLRLAGARLAHGLSMVDGLVQGWFDVVEASMTASLDLRGVLVTGGISADGAQVGGNVQVSPSEATDPVVMGDMSWFGARIGGSFWVVDTYVGGSLTLRSADVTLDTILRGTVVAGVGDALATEADDGTDSYSLDARGLKVGGGMSLRPVPGASHGEERRVFTTAGPIDMRNVDIEGDLLLSDARFGGFLLIEDARLGANLDAHRVAIAGGRVHDADADEVDAFIANRVDVTGDLSLNGDGPFDAKGAVTLRGARIGGRLDLRGDVSTSHLDLREARCWRFSPPSGPAPPVGHALFHGFAFETLDDDTDVEGRLDWIRRQGFAEQWSPHPYEALAGFYRRNGDELTARKVLIAKHDDERKHLASPASTGEPPPRGNLWRRFWRWLFSLLLGYGYQRYRAVVLLALVISLAGLTFSRFEAGGAMVSTSAAAATEPCGAEYPCFRPYVYGADVVLPIVDLGQQSAWQPNTLAPGGWLAEAFSWLYVVLGWAVTSVFVAAFTSLVHRD